MLWYNKQVKKYIKLHDSAELRSIGPNAQVVICQQRQSRIRMMLQENEDILPTKVAQDFEVKRDSSPEVLILPTKKTARDDVYMSGSESSSSEEGNLMRLREREVKCK